MESDSLVQILERKASLMVKAVHRSQNKVLISVSPSHVLAELTTINLVLKEKWIALYVQKVLGVMVPMVLGHLLLVTLIRVVQ